MLVLETSDHFKGLIAITLALGHWSLRARAQRFPDYHQQCQDDSDEGSVIAVHQRLALAAVMVVRWSKNLDVIFVMVEMLCISCELVELIQIFHLSL
jgi:hypothetical protein